MKKIKGYDNYYIKKDGKVYNSITGNFLNGSINKPGYLYYRLSKNGKKKMFFAHRLVAENYLKNPDNKRTVNHKDGNKLNNSVKNLEYATHSENIKHAHKTGLMSKPSKREKYCKDINGEKWVSVSDFPMYRISNFGRVVNTKTGFLLKFSKSCGYHKAVLSNCGLRKDFLVHNLVYFSFNQEEKIDGFVLGHLNGDKLDNRLENLKYVSESERAMLAFYDSKTNNSYRKVYQYDLNNNLKRTFPSSKEAGRILNLDPSSISKVCRKVNKTCGNFIFRYE